MDFSDCCLVLGALFLVRSWFWWTEHQHVTMPFAVGLPKNVRLPEIPEHSFFMLEAEKAGTPRVLFAFGTAACSAIWHDTMN